MIFLSLSQNNLQPFIKCTMATIPKTPHSHEPNLEIDFANPADAREISDVWYECFPDPFIRKMFPQIPSVQQWWDDANIFDMINRPAAKYLKVTDLAANDGKGKIVGYAKWFVPVEGQRPELENRFPPWAEGSGKDLCSRFFGHLVLERRKLLGDRQHYCELSLPLLINLQYPNRSENRERVGYHMREQGSSEIQIVRPT